MNKYNDFLFLMKCTWTCTNFVLGYFSIRTFYFCCCFYFQITFSWLCFISAQIGNTQTELKKLAEQNPELKDAYIAKQRRLKVNY